MPPSSCAKRTGFRPKFSGDTNAGDSDQITPVPPVQSKPKEPDPDLDLEAGQSKASLAKLPARATNGEPAVMKPRGNKEKEQMPPVRRPTNSDGGRNLGENAGEESRRALRDEEGAPIDALPQSVVDDDGFVWRRSHMKYELSDTPGLVPIGLYGFQHYLSMLGSLILIPLMLVPVMGSTYEDTANVVSTVLFVSELTTLLHTSFGSRLPLIQGPSFVYLAPALAIINSPEFSGLNRNTFKHIMKELQGAITIGSPFQTFLGYSGLMTLLLRLINPVVVASAVAAVGLSFYSYGFPRVVLGHRVCLVYAVPFGLAITWTAAFLLTEAGVYSHKGCDVNTPASNMISDHCRRHVLRTKQCRVDTSHALKSAPWLRFPYPLQWGTPLFHWKTSLIMCVVSIISSVDSVGSYHASSLLVASGPPTPGILSRGIGLEGISSILAGLWATGTGSTTLMENVHTIAVTKMGSRRAVELSACVLIVLSLIGKIGGFLASIPQVMVAALLYFMWAMLTALGLSNLRHSEAGSSRNIIIVGLSLFFSLSIPAYFQHYGTSPNTNSSVLSYFRPCMVASHGPFHTKYSGLNCVLNTLLSLHTVVAFLLALILDNTVPGTRQERGVYVWSDPETARRDTAVTKDCFYQRPFLGRSSDQEIEASQV